jgi:hypothetical protein
MLLSGRISCVAALFGVLIVTAIAAPAHAANPLEMNFWLSGPRYDGDLPPCDSSAALSEIQGNFSHKEGRYWNSPLAIVSFEAIHETAFSPWAAQAIPRRFCSAVAQLSDGIRRPVHYSIVEGMGAIGASWGVEWCVVGLDRNWAYNPACRAARP